uniref:NADH dehydrogenase subunit 6 n=1 Tax=Strongyloides venezuelensis TaxID=75913 RepID=A0A0N7KVG7_STRVS|nr:NADH dehydrogenase subunit 6 [Strongyloides venezuelensis]BAT21225.1 NADH dehydrogenase subunit 6 [Strongyloides venezuelensis]
MWYWLFLSLFICSLSYYNMDPLKSCLLLVLSLLVVLPVISYSNYLWYSYFVCMLFLSGIFVVMVYFSSLCNYFFGVSKYGLFILFFVLFGLNFYMSYDYHMFLLNSFYYSVYFGWFVFIIFCLLFFLSVVSYILDVKGALRKF